MKNQITKFYILLRSILPKDLPLDLIDLPTFGGMAMIFAGEHSIRDVIAFPKTASAVSLMDDSPATVDEIQLKDLHIKVR